METKVDRLARRTTAFRNHGQQTVGQTWLGMQTRTRIKVLVESDGAGDRERREGEVRETS